MRVLIVKTSSLGDLIHTFPALTDARAMLPEIEFHWMVEEAFSQVPYWHPAVSKIIPIGLRRWRQGWHRSWKKGEIRRFAADLKQHTYDLVIDAQGLLKSALPARMAQGPVTGYDRRSLREPLASLFYHRRLAVSRELHAIERIRSLFAQALEYPRPDSFPEAGIATDVQVRNSSLVFLHSTTWPSKHWPVPYWVELTRLASAAGHEVLYPWYEAEERLRAERIMTEAGSGKLLPRLDLNGLKEILSKAAGVVGVDTGLAHLAAALNTPAVTLYGPTVEGLTGALGPVQKNLVSAFHCAPCLQRQCSYQGESEVHPACFASLSPHQVWTALQNQMAIE